jgi:hypothetical protein
MKKNFKRKLVALILAMVLLAAVPMMTVSARGGNGTIQLAALGNGSLILSTCRLYASGSTIGVGGGSGLDLYISISGADVNGRHYQSIRWNINVPSVSAGISANARLDYAMSYHYIMNMNTGHDITGAIYLH